MPTRPLSSGKKDSKKGKKGKKKASKAGAIDPHQEEIDRLIREREEIRSKFNVVCSKLMENVNMDDFQADVDLSKQQPSDVSINHLSAMIDQICYYRVAFLSLFQEGDDNEKISVSKKMTQLAIEEPDMFRKRLTPEQRLTFVTRERDIWKENAQLLQIMYATIVDQLEMGMFKKVTPNTEEILQKHRLNLEDVCLIFSSSRIQSINDAQKLRDKKKLDKVLNGFRDQQAFFDFDPPETAAVIPVKTSHSTLGDLQPFNSLNNRIRSASTRRSVSFAPDVNIMNDDDDIEARDDLQGKLVPDRSVRSPDEYQQQQAPTTFDTYSHPEQYQEKYTDSDYHSSLSIASSYDYRPVVKSPLPQKYRRPLANEIPVNKMDSNLRMLIIKELSKSGHNERPISRMSSNYTGSASSDNQSRRRTRRSSEETPEWIELARLIGIDESEIDHWSSQNLQYPAGRVISAWCNYASPAPTVAELHTVLSSKELRRADLARYIETMYIIQ